MVINKRLHHCTILTLSTSIVLFLTFLTLFWLTPPGRAAPPAGPTQPMVFLYPAHQIITATKTATPASTLAPGQILTYTIAFKSDVAGTVIITDAVPASTTYRAGSITSVVAATTSNSVIADDSLGSMMIWTVTNAVTDSLFNLSFAVIVDSAVNSGTTIANTAWLSDAVEITMTTPVTNTFPPPILVYLPIILKSTPNVTGTQFFVNSINTGGVSLIEVSSGGNVVLVCGVNDNTRELCGLLPEGTYTLVASTINCGQVTSLQTISGPEYTFDLTCDDEPPPPTGDTELYIDSVLSNTGSLSLTVNITDPVDDSPVFSCTVSHGFDQFCGIFPAGHYKVSVLTANCGLLETERDFPEGVHNLSVTCVNRKLGILRLEPHE